MDALEISPKQKTQLHRVADLLLVVYHTLVEMRYLEPEDIEEGPHDVSELMPYYESLGLDPTVIYLYSILPYVDAGDRSFFQGGDFADFRDRGHVKIGRDPMYTGPFEEGAKWGDDDGPYMRPWYAALSHCGNHCSFLVYDTRKDEIAIIGQMDCGSNDPDINKRWSEGWTDEDDIDEGVEADNDGSGDGNSANDNESGGEDEQDEDERDEGDDNSDSGVSGMEHEEDDGDHDDDDGDNEDDEEEEEEEEEEDDGMIEEEGTICQIDSRRAAPVLRDMNRWYRELQTTFEGENTPRRWSDDKEDFDITIAEVFRRHGWPGKDFDGDGFEVDLERREARSSVKHDVEEPRRQVSAKKYPVERMDEDMRRLQGQIDAATANTEKKEKTSNDDKTGEEALWMTRWELFETGRMRDHMANDLKEAEEWAERDFPGGEWRNKEDMPLLEYEHLRQKSEEYQDRLREKKEKSMTEEAEAEAEKEKKQADVNTEASKEEDGREESDSQPPCKKQRLLPLRSLPREARRPALLRRAAEASRADAARLCGEARVAASDDKFLAGPTPQESTVEDRREYSRKILARLEGDLAAMREWAAADNLPPGMTATRAKVDAAIACVEEQAKGCRSLIH
ncbi:hypothetical protein PGQ11_007088 [Apiospora arundinis]|uniref:Knr4/Smi1-like domain-containing protein n=1 Tax=Apiospora arundinis TaxID=335852 RepID=A0ABR2IUN9_9PEZI